MSICHLPLKLCSVYRELYDSAIDDMLLAVMLAIVLVYIVMAAQFESFKYPFVIMFTVPLMIIGVAIAMFATHTLIGVTSVIGILVLVGIVVNNGIVLVDYINQQKAWVCQLMRQYYSLAKIVYVRF